jgi:hypothetical protein
MMVLPSSTVGNPAVTHLGGIVLRLNSPAVSLEHFATLWNSNPRAEREKGRLKERLQDHPGTSSERSPEDC